MQDIFQITSYSVFIIKVKYFIRSFQCKNAVQNARAMLYCGEQCVCLDNNYNNCVHE